MHRVGKSRFAVVCMKKDTPVMIVTMGFAQKTSRRQSNLPLPTPVYLFSLRRRLKTTATSSSHLETAGTGSCTALSVRQHCVLAQLPALTSHDGRTLAANGLFSCYTCSYRSQHEGMKGKTTTFIHSFVLLNIAGTVTCQARDKGIHR